MLSVSLLSITLGVFAGNGIVQNASKDAAKGAINAAEQNLDAGKVAKGAKQVGKGVLDSAADAAPLLESQLFHQADKNKRLVGNLAGQVTRDVMVAGTEEMERALGSDGKGPLANAMTATAERVTDAALRGVVAQLSGWTLVAAFVLGGLSTLLFGGALLLLYLAFTRRRVEVVGLRSPLPAT
jgi:hypothetical protein